ncbi:hypothetical protein AMTR_s00050p00189150 [Amborella trichopoda]|uniref:Receptor-like PK ALE2 N-terminal domain-containing protein n=1 Tax=Amborella trichopoda TaxID=13333 RepID=W1PXE4_AMBTC|nr:hypothetical protein AMTR_s00050p00189150 [Amborella trichopoda]
MNATGTYHPLRHHLVQQMGHSSIAFPPLNQGFRFPHGSSESTLSSQRSSAGHIPWIQPTKEFIPSMKFQNYKGKQNLGPSPAPTFPPEGSFVSPSSNPPEQYEILPGTVSAPTFTPSYDCDQVTCSDPLTSTPIGSPCGCVLPMQVELSLGVAPYAVFPLVEELEIEVAAGTYLKQSQVRIMGANALSQDQEKTVVNIDLVPLGERFDNTTALLTYDRFWRKKVVIDKILFGDYEVIYVRYPGSNQFSSSSFRFLSFSSFIYIWIFVVQILSVSYQGSLHHRHPTLRMDLLRLVLVQFLEVMKNL